MNAVSIIPLTLERPLSIPPLAREDPRIYRASICALESHWERLSRLLSEAELRRAAAYRIPATRRRFEVVRGALRSLLSTLLDCDPRAVTIATNTEGKPQLGAAGEPPLHFNVSHSRDLALFAVCDCAPVGVDAEYIDQDLDAEIVMQTAFSESERAACHAAGEADARKEFFRVWTRKEARIKARGLAMAHRFFGSVEHIPVVDLQLNDQYAGALAVYRDGAARKNCMPGWPVVSSSAHFCHPSLQESIQ